MASVSSVLAGSYGFTKERFWVEINEIKLALPRLPKEYKGLKLAHFSDLHMGFFYEPQHFSREMEKINHFKPDIICFTGDLVDNELDHMDETVELLRKLHAPLGKFAVLGNHDYYRDDELVAAHLTKAGFQVLRNQHAVVRRGSDVLYMLGVEDMTMSTPDIVRAAEGVPLDGCKILLSHAPNFALETLEHKIDLQLSGHSHGGQVRLPLIGHLVLPPNADRFPDGLQRVQETQMMVYTTRGLGTTHLPVRFYCRPELTFFTFIH